MKVLGLMSGTSADGIDVAIANIDGNPENLSIEQIAFETLPWPEEERDLIFRLFEGNTPTDLICRANFTLAERFAAAALEATANANLRPEQIDLIGSHGQTLWHDVDAATGNVTSTLQIGDPSVIAARTGITTVGNFRTADVAAGGQGAPLVSIFDWLLLRPPAQLNGVDQGWRAVQNIGGIGNVTFLPPLGVDALPLAFDTGPGNAIMDWAVTEVTNGEQLFDEGGHLAAQGQVNFSLLETWLDKPYFVQPPPKTTGRELFSAAYAQTLRNEANEHGLTDADFIATVTALTATSIAQAYHDFAPGPLAQVAVAGGGANNPFLMALMAEQIRGVFGREVEVITHQPLGIDGDAKEALTFGLLAYLTIHGWTGNVPACTGARNKQILGQIAPGKNYGRTNMIDTPSTTIDELLQHRKDPSCIRIGIVGGSGSGKSTVCELMQAELTECQVTIISLDKFFKPIDQLPTYYSYYHQAPQPDFNRPDSLRVEEMVAYCQQVSMGGVTIYDGHLALYYPEMRELMDIKCFVDCDLEEMLAVGLLV